MPLNIVRRDITKIKCDAIVNPTNTHLKPTGGTDADIHRAAGPELISLCESLGEMSVGEAVITPAFDLPAKYVIHTVGPVWQGGLAGERTLLRSCYREAMSLAIAHGCTSVAFPLIASGNNGYPRDRVLKEATDVISDFLDKYELDVYIAVYDKAAFSINEELYFDVSEYIGAFYHDADEAAMSEERACEPINMLEICEPAPSRFLGSAAPPKRRARMREKISASKTLDDMLRNMDKGFADTLFDYIDAVGISDVEAYTRSNVDKKTFSKIKCNKDYRPSKITAVSFAIGLRLDIEQTEHLLSTAGICLSRSNKFDVIIEYFITSGKYKTIFDVNEVLYQFDQPCLGVYV